VSGNLFLKEGEYWTIAFDRGVVRIRDAKGLHYIAALLRQPRTEIHAIALRGLAGPGNSLDSGDARQAERARLMVTQRIKASLQKISESSPALGDHLQKAIRTGLFCRYDPPVRVSWKV
jgi:hypothetical protein